MQPCQEEYSTPLAGYDNMTRTFALRRRGGGACKGTYHGHGGQGQNADVFRNCVDVGERKAKSVRSVWAYKEVLPESGAEAAGAGVRPQ